MQFPMQFKNSEGQMIDIDLAKARHTIILGGSVEPLRLDPLEAARSSPEFIVQLLEQYAGVKLNDEKKTTCTFDSFGSPRRRDHARPV